MFSTRAPNKEAIVHLLPTLLLTLLGEIVSGGCSACFLALGIGADTPQWSAAERGVGAKARPEGERPK